MTLLILLSLDKPEFFFEIEKKGFLISFGLFDQTSSIRFLLIDLRFTFLILNKKFSRFSVCNFGSNPIVIFFFVLITSLGNLFGIVKTLNFLPDCLTA